MIDSPVFSRRQFLTTTALAAAAGGRPWLRAETAPARFKIIVFTKPFDTLSFDETADLVAEVGWDGIECAVRAKAGHIAPARVEEDLPRMVEVMTRRGREVTIVTTEITKVDPLAEKVLRTAAKLGVKRYRLGFVRYQKDRPIAETVRETAAAMKDLVALNRELGLQGGFQNHSGSDYFGAPVWDIWSVVKDFPPEQLGICFDIGHATLEGGLSWPIQARLMEKNFVAVYFKDFRWEKTEKGWQPRWCALGEGTVSKTFVANLKQFGYTGPLSQHHEYPDLGKGPEMMANFKKDLATLREWLAA